jgi:hypothetical protein
MLALVVSFILSSVGFYLSYDKALNPPVYAEFRSVYRAHENQLGSATGRVVADGAYQAWHERATVVWISKLPGFVILPVHSQNWIPDDDMAAWDPRLASDGYVTGILNRSIPDGLFPPTRGMARLFLQDPDYWIQKVGWREADCTYETGMIHFQRFQHGWIIGDFRQRMDMPYGKAIVILDDGQRFPETLEGHDAPVCRNDVPH